MLRLLIAALLLLATPALAQSAPGGVEVRGGQGQGYRRTVFAWDEAAGKVVYEASTLPSGDVEVAFNRPAETAVGVGFTVTSTDPLRVLFPLKPGQRIRDFQLGGRVFVDVYDAPRDAPGDAPKPKPKPKPEPEPEPQAPLEPQEVAAPPPGPAAPLARAAAQGHEDAHLPSGIGAPYIVGLASTQILHLCAFMDPAAGTLWAVAQAPEQAPLAPSIAIPAGRPPTPPDLTPVKAESAAITKAWATPVERGAGARARGGGLSWEVIVDAGAPPEAPETLPVPTRTDDGRAALLWPLAEAMQPRAVARLADPLRGGPPIIAVPVLDADHYAGAGGRYADLDILPSAAGLAIRPRVDDLEVTLTERGALITRPGGLRLSLTEAGEALGEQDEEHAGTDHEGAFGHDRPEGTVVPELYPLYAWRGGPPEELARSKTLILGNLHAIPEAARVKNVLTLARMYLAHGRGVEALAMLRYASQEIPALEGAADFIAWRGAAGALAHRSADAFADLSHPALAGFAEIDYWRAAALADLGDWPQAAQVLPPAPGPLPAYPEPVRTRLALFLAEAALRGGKTEQGQAFLALAQTPESRALKPSFTAARSYLLGVAAQQRGDIGTAMTYWHPVASGADVRYRTKALLALTTAMVEAGHLTPEQAIDRLEGARYAWRGDGLEAQMLFDLGRTYFEAGQYLKGLTLMRRAATVVPGSGFSRTVVAEMTRMFTALFLVPEQLAALTAVQAATVYEQFGELTPVGAEGDMVAVRLADRLIAAGLLERGAGLLREQIDHRLQGEPKRDAGIRLAAIYLMDEKPDAALEALEIAQALCAQGDPCGREIALLRAQALSHKGDTAAAMRLVGRAGTDATDAARLQAAIAWEAQEWHAAQAALDDLARAMGADPREVVTPEQADVILRRAIALRLAGREAALAQWRATWGPGMADLPQGPLFAVVSASGSSPPNPAVADAQRWEKSLSEVDLFARFLERYKTVGAPP